MIRIALILLALTTAAHAQIALTPQWDARATTLTASDLARAKRSQDAPWVQAQTSGPRRPEQQAMAPVQFGTFSQAYLDRRQLKRWKELCKGAGRYQAMSEAYEAGKPDPCQPGAKK